MNTTVTVVGAGPAGLLTARHLAEQGWQVSVIEEHSGIGKPVQCAGLISKSGTFINKLSIKESIVNEIQGARIYAPNGECLSIHKYETVAYVIDRELFDKECQKEAEKLGVEVRRNCKLIDLRSDTAFVKQDERGEMIKTKVVVGADGASSKVRSSAGIHLPSDNFANCFQIRAKGSFDRDFVELYFGSFAENFFAWIIPEGKHNARIGIGTTAKKNARQCLEEFVRKKGLEVEKIDETAGLIPIGPPLKEVSRGNTVLVGDAAFHTKATTGGGIITGSIGARLASEAITDHLRKNKPLKEYDKAVARELNKDLLIHWKVRKFLNMQDDDSLNKLFAKLKHAKIEQFLEKYGNMDQPSLFAGKLLANPKIWVMLPEAISVLR